MLNVVGIRCYISIRLFSFSVRCAVYIGETERIFQFDSQFKVGQIKISPETYFCKKIEWICHDQLVIQIIGSFNGKIVTCVASRYNIGSEIIQPFGFIF